MNKEQEHLDKVNLVEKETLLTGLQMEKAIASVVKYDALIKKLDKRKDPISAIRWLRAYKKRQKSFIEGRALCDLHAVQITQWEMLLADYKKLF